MKKNTVIFGDSISLPDNAQKHNNNQNLVHQFTRTLSLALYGSFISNHLTIKINDEILLDVEKGYPFLFISIHEIQWQYI
jgi:hypothetical protein